MQRNMQLMHLFEQKSTFYYNAKCNTPPVDTINLSRLVKSFSGTFCTVYKNVSQSKKWIHLFGT